jgi:cytochrome P450
MKPLPTPGLSAGWQALQSLVKDRNLLTPLLALHGQLGDAFRLSFPVFNPVVLAGPEAARFVLVDGRQDLRWRIETDPVAQLLGHGVLVEDGADHDQLRSLLSPAFHRQVMEQEVNTMLAGTDEITGMWHEGQTVDVLDAMRRIALLNLTRALFAVDLAPHFSRVWPPLLRTLNYIAPGPWLLWPGLPRPGYAPALKQMDVFLYQLIDERRALGCQGDDLLSLMVNAGLSAKLIRDQLLTMLIAGHDTATALLSWALVALGQQPALLHQAQGEVDAILGGQPPTAANIQQLHFLERVIKETLRLYPPIHVGNRLAARDLEFAGYRIPAGARVLFSIFLTHRHPQYWPEPNRFDPERFNPATHPSPAPFTYLPFGGGPRFCIGAQMAQIESKVVLARLLQKFNFQLLSGRAALRMGATLEPNPSPRFKVSLRPFSI